MEIAKDYDALLTLIGEERVEELRSEWNHETSDEETQEWRDELTPAERLLVDEWDKRYDAGVLRICQKILAAEKSNKAVKR